MQILSKVGQTLYFLISLVLVFNTGLSAQDTIKRPLEKALEAMGVESAAPPEAAFLERKRLSELQE